MDRISNKSIQMKSITNLKQPPYNNVKSNFDNTKYTENNKNN